MSKTGRNTTGSGTPSSRHTLALGRIAGLGCAAVLLLTAAACGNGDSSAPAAAGRGTAQPDVQFDLAATATWQDLLNAIGRSDELSCIDEAISDQDLPGDFLDLPLFDEDGYSIWPVWSSVYFGVVEEGESHWPASIWKCLDSDTLAAAYISSQYGALLRQGLVPGEIPEDCVQELVNDPEFTGATTATLTSEREFDEGEQLDEFFAALDERFFFGLLECPLPTEADADQPAPSETAQADDDAGETAGGERLSAEAVYSRIAPSIPLIETQSAIGSGILIDGGYVVTNYHVVWPHDSAWIVFPDGTEFADVPVIGWDPFADLAVLGVVSHSAPPLRLADGEDLSIGSDVFLVGYPAEMDLFPEPSITGGILSRVREWDRYAVTMFQTDAQIAGGQSGGALVDSRGRVIGISTWSFEDGGFSVATSAADDVEIVESLIADNEEFAFSDRRAPIGTGEFEVQVDLANGWDSRTFLFEALAGTTVSVELDGPSDGAITVSGPDGILLEVDDGYSGVESGTVELLSDGIHYVTVSTASGDLRDPAGYWLASSVRLRAFHDPDDGAHLSVDYQMGAVIDYYGDIDWYLTTLTEGETVVLRTDAIATDTFLAVAPVADAEALVFDDDSGSTLFGDSFNAEIVYTAPVSGDYYIVAGDALGAGGGSYFLAIDYDPALGPDDSVEIPDTAATSRAGDYFSGDYFSFEATEGETHHGSIGHPDDVHSYSFEAIEGETYQIDVEPMALFDPVATLYNEYAVELAYNDDHGDYLASRIVWTAPLSGDYYVEVHGLGGETGSYTLTITTTDLDDQQPTPQPQSPLLPTRLTDNDHEDWSPAWSPDGSRIAFTSYRSYLQDDDLEIYVMNADGSGVVQLTANSAWDSDPAWSPDGSRIAFSSTRDGDEEIYVMNADGSGVVQLTANSAWDSEPAWSPDGSRIAYSSSIRGEDAEIYIMNADGSGIVPLTDSSDDDWMPAWSPDGSRIAFSSTRSGGAEIYVMNADGSGVTRLTDDSGSSWKPAWSPDGSRIAFSSSRDRDWRIYVMNADGSSVIQLADDSYWSEDPAWSPDGSRIAFSSGEDGDWEIVVLVVDESGALVYQPVEEEPTAESALPGDGVDVIAGRADWYSGYFQAELYKQLLGELGFNVSDPAEQELPPSLAYLAMAEGAMDYWPNSWYPAHRPFFEEELADGTLVADHVSIVGDEMIAGGLEGFLITKSFADEYGVYTMDELNSNVAALRAFDATDPVPGNGMADIFSCPESWCGSVVTDHIAFSGWDNIQPTSADYDAMFALAVDSVNERVPMVFYTWTPSAFITRLQPGGNVYWMGFNDRQFGADGSSGFATINPQQCPSAAHTDNGMCPIGWTANDILVTARNEFLDANPTAETLFELVKLPIIDVSLAIAAQEEEGAHPADLAAEWIADNRRLVDRWIAAALVAA